MTSRQIQFLVGLLIIVVIGIGLVVVADTNRRKLAAGMEAERAAARVDARNAEADQQEQQAKPETGETQETAEAADDEAAGKPSFDIARIESTGDGVLAGLAKPGASVELMANGEPISATTANEVGEWVIVLEKPLAAGSHDLALRATPAGGKSAISEDSIAVVVPDNPSGEVLVVASRPGQASEILARPSTAETPETAATLESSAGEAADASGETAQGAPETQIAALEEQAAPDTAPAAAAADESPETAADAVDTASEPETAVPADVKAGDTASGMEADETAAIGADSQSDVEEAAAAISEAAKAGAMTEPAGASTEDTQTASAAAQADRQPAETLSAEAQPAETSSSDASVAEAQSEQLKAEQMAAVDQPTESAETASARDAAAAQSDTAVSTMEKTSGPEMAAPETNVAVAGAPEAATSAADQAASAPAVDEQPGAALAEPESEPVVEEPKRQFKLALDAVETEGRMVYAAGTGNPGALVRVYADDTFIGETSANDDGRWLLETSAEIAAGNVVVRADELVAGSADVVRRAEVPFFKQADAIALLPTTASGSGGASGAASGVAVTGPKSVIIRSGDNLWTISRRTYGRGIRYTTIYQANDDQIRNPHMIFPGQVFVLPDGDKTWTQ
jgi:hypothetical protein